jgi:hypothetical protein
MGNWGRLFMWRGATLPYSFGGGRQPFAVSSSVSVYCTVAPPPSVSGVTVRTRVILMKTVPPSDDVALAQLTFASARRFGRDNVIRRP